MSLWVEVDIRTQFEMYQVTIRLLDIQVDMMSQESDREVQSSGKVQMERWMLKSSTYRHGLKQMKPP